MDVKAVSKVLIIIYFVNLLLYSFSTLFDFVVFEKIAFLVRFPIFMILYYINSKKRIGIYFLALILYQIATIFYTSALPNMFVYGTITSLFFKICVLLLILEMAKSINFLAVLLASLPFFVIYLFIIQFVFSALRETYFIWIINAFLTSLIGGIAIMADLHNSTKKSVWLLISSILLIIQIGAFFINNFYVRSDGIFQILVIAYGVSQYTFYRYMILKEFENNEKDISTS
jgi:hypothetical protein